MRARWARSWLSFGERLAFDDALRPPISNGVIAYPDALYHIKAADVRRAIDVVLAHRTARLKRLRDAQRSA